MLGFLYGQTEYNLLSNACKLDEYVSLAKQNNFKFLSITDPNLYGFYKFYKACLKEDIKPVIGLELTILNKLEEDVFLLYPLTNLGLTNLFKIETAKQNKTLDINYLIEHSIDIAFILVISKSNIFRSINLVDELTYKLNYYKEAFKHFYLGATTQEKALKELNIQAVEFASNIGILSVYIHQMKYLTLNDKVVYDTLKAIDNQKDDIEGDFTFFNDSDIELMYPELFENTYDLVAKIDYKIEKKEVMPKYIGDVDSDQKLIELANKGLARRLKTKINANYDIYKKRLNYELNIITKMHFSDYFLIVYDFINYAKRNDIYVGPGRGSAASSLVAYALGITDISPLDFNLLFERFLNPERISMPDIDTDFPDNKREDVINYVSNLYGKNHVSSITTFGTFSYKSSLRDVARVKKINESIIKEISKLLNEYDIDTLLHNLELNDTYKEILYIIKRLDGMPRNTSTHAAGIIMAGEDLTNLIPLQVGMNNISQSELEYEDLNELGLLKMDFLGIRNLTIIANILEEANIKQKDFRNITLDDKVVYKILQRADTLGIFQLESDGIRRVLVKLKPTSFNDLVAVLALYRPGPMDNIDEFISRKHGKPFSYLHPDLEPILKETYGIIVYQEQIMLIARKFAGYSLGKADILRKAISKKKLEEMEKLREDFISSCQNNGYDLDLANTIFELIVKFSDYGFNKAHSVVYAKIAYEMTYLKAHYFPLFMANILNNVIGSETTLDEYIKYAKRHSLEIVNPDINISTSRFTYHNKKLYMPLTCIKQVGPLIANKIVEERNNSPYKSYEDFVIRTKLPENLMTNLIYAGAFDSFNIDYASLLENRTSQASMIANLIGADRINKVDTKYDEKELAQKEKEVLGFNLKYDLTKQIKEVRLNNNLYALSNINYKYSNNVIVKFSNLRETNTKKGKILKGNIYDDTDSISFVIFNDLYNEVKDLINQDDIYKVGFNMKTDQNNLSSAIISYVLPLKKAK